MTRTIRKIEKIMTMNESDRHVGERRGGESVRCDDEAREATCGEVSPS